ncbi:MAG TPA: TonB-dependent receptor [Bryobacteraceae bacterium]|nr:TonB-dependent receptor [Bryobacteraceae bacterium]
MKKACACSLVLITLLASVAAWAQVSTSAITGLVTDSSAAVVPAATVQAKNEDTGVVYEGVTNASGNYSFASVPPGPYTITISKQGFHTFVGVHNVLTVGQPLVVDASLRVGAASETVQVEGTYQRIETSNATISDVVTGDQAVNLPLNGRNPLSLLTLEPGVVQRTNSNTGSGTHVFGSRDRSHNVTIDGIDANESTVPNPQSNLQRLQPDNVQEFRTITLGATAENGRNSGANVMVATKGGTNGFHGTGFYFNRNTDFNANEWFNNASKIAPPQLKLHQYGGDIGGPIKKDKTFFFFSVQPNLILLSQPISAVFGTPSVYTSAMRNGIFRFVRGTVSAGGKNFTRNSNSLVDAGGNLLPGIATCSAANGFQNCVDSYNIFANDPAGIGGDPLTMGLIKNEPLPNNFSSGDGLNTGGFSWNPPSKFAGPQYMGRVDHTFGPNDNLFVRWLQSRYDTQQGDFLNSRPEVFPGFPPLGEVTRIARNLAVSYRHTFSPTLVNELTAGFNRFAFAFTFGESNPDFGNAAKLPPWGDQCLFGSFVNISTPYCISPHTARAVTTRQVIDNVSKVIGSHTIHAGINFRWYIHNDSRGFFGSKAVVPVVEFNGSQRPGNFLNIPGTIGGNPATTPFASDINVLQQAIVETTGIPYLVQQGYLANFNTNQYVATRYATVYTRLHQYDTYISDEWKVRPNLTINAGIRWEYNPAPYDAQQTLVPDRPIDGSQGTVSFVKAGGWIKNNNIGAVAPRIGIAWSPDQKTAVRIGYGIFFDTLSSFQVTAMAGFMPGFLQNCTSTVDGSGSISTTAGCITPSGTVNRLSKGYPLSIAAPTITPSAALSPQPQPGNLAPATGVFDPNLKTPTVHEWDLTIQRELPGHFVSEVGYVGKRGTRLYRAYDINQISTSQPGFLQSFNTARGNIFAGCKADGTGCPAGVTGQTPTLLLSLSNATFVNSSTSLSDLQRGNIGNMAVRLDNQATSSWLVAKGFPANYFRPSPQFGSIFYQDSGGDSTYHGMFLAVHRRFEQGLTFGLSYTFSKSIDDMSVDPTGASTGGGLSATSFSRTPTDVHNFRLDRALSDFNNTHVLLINMLYELPFGRHKQFLSNAPKWLDEIVGGWSITNIYTYQSGEPYTINSGVRTTNGAHNSSAMILGPGDPGSLQFINGIKGPVMYQASSLITSTADPHYDCVQISGGQTFFCIPPPGSVGAGRNFAQSPAFWNLDSGLAKNFTITERVKLQFRAEAFNVLNHPNFASPLAASVGSPTITSTVFGQTCCSTVSVPSSANVISTGEPNRVLQLGLKLNF